MMVVLVLSLVFTIAASVSIWFYWVALFPCVLLKSRLTIQQISDEIHLAVREGKISSESRGFIELQYFLDLGRRVVRHADLLGSAPKQKPQRHEHEELESRIEAIMKDVPEIRKAFFNSQRWVIALWIATRPIYFVPVGVILVLSYFSESAERVAESKKEEVFAVASCLPA
jgi:hypothetical protein